MRQQQFKRHSRGGRFRKDEIGDSGLRSMKEQQQRSIDHLKAQNARQVEIDNTFLRGLNRKDEVEEWNANQIKKVEDAAYQTRRNAITVRSQTEYDYWMGLAKQYGEQAKYWQGWSTTGAQAFGKLAGAAAKYAKNEIASASITQLYASDYRNALFTAENLRLKVTSPLNTDQDRNRNDPDIQNKLNQYKLGHSDAVATQFVEDVKANLNQIDFNIERVAGDQLNQNPIAVYKSYLDDLFTTSGINRNTAAGRNLSAMIMSRATAYQHRASLVKNYSQSQSDIQTWAKTYAGDPSTFNWNQGIITLRGSIKKDAYNRYLTPSQHNTNPKEAAIELAQILIDNNIVTTNEDLDKILGHLTPLNDGKGGFTADSLYDPRDSVKKYKYPLALSKDTLNKLNKRPTWGGKHLDLQTQFTKMLKTKTDLMYSQGKQQLQQRYIRENQEFDAKYFSETIEGGEPNPNYVDINDYDAVGRLLDQYRENPLITNRLKFARYFNPKNHTKGAKQLLLGKAYEDNDASRFFEIYNTLSPDEVKYYKTKANNLMSLNANGITYSRQQAKAKTLEQGISKSLGLPGYKADNSATYMVNAYINRSRQLYKELSAPTILDPITRSEIPNPGYIQNVSNREIELDKRMEEEVSSGTGIWRVDPGHETGAGIKWLAWSGEDSEIASQEDLVNYFNPNSQVILNAEQVVNGLKSQGKVLEGQDTVDTWHRERLAGTPLTITDNIRRVAQITGSPIHEIMNAVIKNSNNPGGLQVKPNEASLAENKVEFFDTGRDDFMRTIWEDTPNTFDVQKDSSGLQKLKIGGQYWKNVSPTDRIKIGGIADFYSQTGEIPKRPEIDWFKDNLINNISLEESFQQTLQISPDQQSWNPEIIRDLGKLFPDYFYDYHTNTIRKRGGK